jgi:hypothetical protein
MEHIINPWFFYWINVADALNVAFVIGVVVGVITMIVGGIVIGCNSGIDEDGVTRGKKTFKTGVLVVIICVFPAIFIPTKTTLIQMAVADKLTYNNVEQVLDSGKNIKNELKQDVLDIINAIGDESAKGTERE